MWDVEDFLRGQRRVIDQLFDYRYSQLLFVFSLLIHEGHLNEDELSALAEEKIDIVRRNLP